MVCNKFNRKLIDNKTNLWYGGVCKDANTGDFVKDKIYRPYGTWFGSVFPVTNMLSIRDFQSFYYFPVLRKYENIETGARTVNSIKNFTDTWARIPDWIWINIKPAANFMEIGARTMKFVGNFPDTNPESTRKAARIFDWIGINRKHAARILKRGAKK